MVRFERTRAGPATGSTASGTGGATGVPAPPWVSPALVPRRRRHRAVFLAAGVYNIAWGLFSVTYPQWLFDLAGMDRALHPQIFATLGMVIGLYGILYLAVAAYPEHGWLCAAVGLAGKILGPAGLAWLLMTGVWPAATAVICLTNDVIWWVPFAQYLRDARPSGWQWAQAATPS